MEKFIIRGGHPLRGAVQVSGAKNAALPLLAAALLTEEECAFDNVPNIGDVRTMLELLDYLGCDVSFDAKRHRALVWARNLHRFAAPIHLVQQMRASFLVTGPLLARCGQVRAPAPGGCAIGTRPKNVDLKSFLQMGATIDYENGEYVFQAQRLRGAKLYFDYPSHTGTENVLMAACLVPGTTVIKNACVEPEVVSLAQCLEQMGAKIRGAGSSVIEVEGVPALHGVRHRVIPDRIEAGTFAIAAAITSGDIAIYDVLLPHMDPLTHKLMEAGVEVEEGFGTYSVRRDGPLEPVEVQTLHYPGFPTDLQAPFAALLTQARGRSEVYERVYDDRLHYTAELQKMGAKFQVTGAKAVIDGPASLVGTSVQALDIRAGAALMIAGLAAQGVTEISGVHHIYRGYEDIGGKLRALGADIERVDN